MKSLDRLRSLCLALLALAPAVAGAAGLNLGTTPLYLGASVQPIVMLNLPRDHQLFMKAYNDFTDLDGDGVPDTNYKHSIVYFGYFDSYKCYTYDTTNRRFNPVAAASARVATATDRYCSDAGVTATSWSGNFLNWVTMSRMDEIRKILYGGLRIIDDNTQTVLERAIIPGDVHAWAKYYDGGATGDIQRLTPFNLSNTPQTYSYSATVKTVTAINRPASISITGISRSGSTATATTATNHLLAVGDSVTVAGSSISNYNGTFTVTATPSTTTFRYTVAGSPSSNPGGTKTVISNTPTAAATAKGGLLSPSPPAAPDPPPTRSTTLDTAAIPIAPPLPSQECCDRQPRPSRRSAPPRRAAWRGARTGIRSSVAAAA
jgi:type IV pilus assembly protein PilY1